MADSLIVSQQLSIVVLFVAVFMHTLNGTLNGNQMGALDIVIALGGYLVWAVCRTSRDLSPSPPLCSHLSLLFGCFKAIAYVSIHVCHIYTVFVL